MFQFVKSENNGYRLFNEETKKEFGEFFQTWNRTPEAKAAITVYEKYKRQYDLKYETLLSLVNYAIMFSEKRKLQNKKCSKEYLIQVTSEVLKLTMDVYKEINSSPE